MLHFNLVFRNVTRSIKDYMIYFLTLVLGVSLFYAYNSISSQPALNDLNYAMEIFKDSLVTYISLLSKFIAVILAFLIIYANQFIMTRRKKDLGVYISLGMSRWQVSSIFAGEIFLIGLFALTAGIGLGFILSQGISVLALKLFVGDATGFRLMFSANATVETILNFTIIFLLVMLFNTRNIINIKPIDLLTPNPKRQELKTTNNYRMFILFILSIIFLCIGMISLLYFETNEKNLSWHLVMVAVGIFLFYYTVSSIMILFLKRNKRLYFNELNTFLFKQLESKMQTNFLVMVILCGLLLASLVILGTGFSTTNSMNKQAKSYTPFDLTILIPFDDNNSPLDKANYDGVPLKENFKDYAESILYKTDFTYEHLFQGQELNLSENDKKALKSRVIFISVTDYNKQMNLSGQEQVQLNSNEYIISTSHEHTENNIELLLQNETELTIGGKELIPSQKNVLNSMVLLTGLNTTNNMGTIITPDDIADKLNPSYYLLNGNFESNEIEGMVYNAMNSKWLEQSLDGNIVYLTQSVIYDSYFGTFGVIAFISSYIGMILMIVTLSVLALQQLTEVQDNKERYQTLSKIGADKRMIYKALFRQIGFYFIAPLVLAAPLSIFATRFVLDKLEPFFGISIKLNMFISLGIICLFYVVYFIVTYQSAKKIIVEDKIK